MKRRSYLALAGTGITAISGCAGLSGSNDPPSTTTPGSSDETTTPESETPEYRPQRYASIVDLETAPLTYALTPTNYHSDDRAEIRMQFSKTATDSHPATLVATLRNANDFETAFRTNRLPLLGSPTSRSPRPLGERYGDSTYRTSLVFAPTANHDLVETAPSVSRDADGFWRADDVTQWLPDTVRLKPEETVHCEYAVVGHPDGGGKGRPTGVYEFRSASDADVQLSVWRTNHPGPEDESRFAGTTVPPLSKEASTSWYHEADATTPIFVRPSTERGSLPEQIEFTVVNRSRKMARCGHWSFYKLVDGEWFLIGPYVQTSDCRGLFPGRSKTWTLDAYHGEALPSSGGKSGGTYGYLGGGRYAAVAGYAHEADRSAALVELVGDPVTVVPTEDATASRSDDTAVVRSPKYEESRSPPARLTVTKADAANRTLIPEQIMRRRYRALRNTLAFFDGDTRRVVLQTDEHVAEQAVGYESDATRFRFEGQAYEARIEREGN